MFKIYHSAIKPVHDKIQFSFKSCRHLLLLFKIAFGAGEYLVDTAAPAGEALKLLKRKNCEYLSGLIDFPGRLGHFSTGSSRPACR